MSNFTKRVKRALTYAVAGTTIAWSVGLAGIPVAFGAAMSGDLIKQADNSAVYYFGADGKRYVFPDERTYKTWYPDFSGVKVIPKAEMESYLIGGNVTYRPGVKMLKIQSDPRVYVIAKGGVLWHVATEAVAKALFGDMWAKQINDLSDSFFVNYTVSVEADGLTPKKINAASEYDKAAQMAGSSTINVDRNIGSGGGTLPPVGAGTASTLSVALSSDTPASGIVVQNAIRVPFTTVNFTASSDGDATIDALVIERGGGAAQDGAFAGILLWDAATDSRISNTARTLGTEHNATFNEDIVVKAGTTRKVIIAGNMAAALTNYAGEVPTLGIKSMVMKGGTTLVGASLPLHGNYQTLNNTVTIGALTVTTGSDNPSNSTQKIGTTDFIFTGLRVTAGSTEHIDITRIVFNQGGTAADADVTNLDLVIDGSVIATVAQATDKNAAFDLRSSPVRIEKGKTKQLNLRGDIASGSSRTIRWDIKKQDDVIAKGQTFGFSPTPTFNNTSEPYHNQGATITINRGTVQIQSTPGTANSNIAEDVKEVTLGKFDFDVRGESLSFESIGVQLRIVQSTGGLGATTSDITSVKLVDPSGKVYGSVDPANNGASNIASGAFGTDSFGTATITDNFILPPGVTTLTVKANLSADFGANDTIRASLHPVAMTVKGVDTGETLVAADKTPAAAQTSAIYTVKTGSLAMSVSNQPVAQNLVGGTQDWVFAEFRLDAADSGEDVKITQMKAELVTNATPAPNQFSNWRVMDGSTTLQTSSSPDPTSGTAGDDATTTFVFVNPMFVTKGTAKTIKIIANVSTAATSGTIRVGMSTVGGGVSATGKDSGQTVTATLSVGAGQIMTLQSAGTLNISGSTQSHPAGLLPANANGVEVGIFQMNAVREPIRIEKIYLTATSTRTRTATSAASAFNQIRAIHLYDGATRLTPEGGVQPTTTNYTESGASGGTSNATVLVDVTSNPIIVPVTSAKDITVKVDTNPVTRYPQASTGDSGQGFTLSINAAGDITAKGAQSGTTLAASAITLGGTTLNAWSVMGTVPSVTVYNDLAVGDKIGGSATLPKLSAGPQKDLYKFKVGADSAGDVYLHTVTFALDQQKATVTNPVIFRTDTGAQVAATTTSPVTQVLTSSRLFQNYAFWFTSDGLAPTAITVAPQRITLGSSRLFTLKGDIACWSDGGCGQASPQGSLSVGFLGDTAFPTTYPDSAVTLYNPGANVNKFVWGDASIIGTNSASGTSTTSEQWFNGFRVRSAVSSIGRLQATSSDVTFNP